MSGYVRTDSGPASKYDAVTPSDTADIPDVPAAGTRGLAWKTAGALCVVRPDGTTKTIPEGVLATGVIHPIRCKRVKATGTGAGMDIWAFWD